MPTNEELMAEAIETLPDWLRFLHEKEAEQDRILAEIRATPLGADDQHPSPEAHAAPQETESRQGREPGVASTPHPLTAGAHHPDGGQETPASGERASNTGSPNPLNWLDDHAAPAAGAPSPLLAPSQDTSRHEALIQSIMSNTDSSKTTSVSTEAPGSDTRETPPSKSPRVGTDQPPSVDPDQTAPADPDQTAPAQWF